MPGATEQQNARELVSIKEFLLSFAVFTFSSFFSTAQPCSARCADSSSRSRIDSAALAVVNLLRSSSHFWSLAS